MKKIILFSLLALVSCKKEPTTEFPLKGNYSYVSTLKSGVRVTSKDLKQGIIDKNNNVILPNEYKSLNVLKDKIVYTKDNMMGILSLNGKNLLKNKYEYIYPFQENYLIKNKGKYGIIDKNEKEIVPPKYDAIRPFKENRAIVVLKNKYGVIDKNGKEIVAPVYEYITDYSDEMAMTVTKDLKAGFLNKNGKEIFDEIFNYTEPFKGKSTAVVQGEKFGVIDKNGNFSIDLQNERINPLGDDLYSIKDQNYFYLINMKNEKILNKKFNSIGEKIEGLISVTLDGKFGYLNSKGDEIIPIIYSELGLPQNELIIAKDDSNQKFGVIDFKNKFVVEPKYSYISSRNKNFFIVGNEEAKEGVVNKNGKIILPLEYSDLEFKGDNLIIGYNKNNEYKLIKINEKSSKVLDLNISEIIDYNNDEIIVKNSEGIKIYK